MYHLNKPVAAICLAVASAFAQAQQATYDFNIPAQPASQVLDALAKQTGLQPFYADGAVKGVQSPGVKGKLSLREALDKALAGTGLTYQFTAEKAVAIKAVPPGVDARKASADATELTPITVSASAVDAGGSLFAGATLKGGTLAARRLATNDSAQLLDGTPGYSTTFGGGVSGLPVINGLGDDRLRVLVNGMTITSACPNHMNPALSYIDPASVESVSVLAGITPVSLGGDSIGGTIAIRSADPVFASAGEGLKSGGSVSAFYRSNGNVSGANARVSLAGENLSIAYSGATVKSGNYKDGAGQIQRSTEYESRNNLLSLATRSGSNLFSLDIGWQDIPYQGYANQYMDMTSNKSLSLNARYKGGFDWGQLEARVYRQHVRHKMDMLTDKASLGWVMPMDTNAVDSGYSVQADIQLSARDLVRVGHEYHRYTLDDWWPAFMMADQAYWNVSAGKRERKALFAEWEARWSTAWTSQLGARFEQVTMNTGPVQGYYSVAGGMDFGQYQPNADAFNAKDRKLTDNNWDFTATARYEPASTVAYDFGFARKTRSPNIYERFAWSNETMAGTMVNWFGDLNAYVGDLDLKPEVAHTLRATADWHDAEQRDWQVKATPFYTEVKNYINTVPNPVADTGMFMGAPPGRARLKFVNHDARLYGLDISARKQLGRAGGDWVGRVAVSYVRGKDVSTGDSLYNIMPLNARFGLDHSLGAWSSSIELQSVAAKNSVDPVRMELKTGNYSLVNLRTGYNWGKVRIDAGIDNLFDKRYDLPLGGLDAFRYAYVPANLAPVRGMGRSAHVGLTLTF
jgi:iron complex outermembrane receptor protein